VKSPPGVPLRTHRPVIRGLSPTRRRKNGGATWPIKANCDTSRPLPSNSGKAMDAAPRNPKTATGSISGCRSYRRGECGQNEAERQHPAHYL
jgi:hypothetical protein